MEKKEVDWAVKKSVYSARNRLFQINGSTTADELEAIARMCYLDLDEAIRALRSSESCDRVS